MSFYTYGHFRQDDGLCFYIGKGNGGRAYDKRRSEYWKRTVAKHGIRIDILAHWDAEEEAFEHEKFLIKCFRDLGHPLANFTDGGEGATLSGERRVIVNGKRSTTLKAKFSQPGYSEIFSKNSVDRWENPEYKKSVGNSISVSLRGKGLSADHKQSLKQAWADPVKKAERGKAIARGKKAALTPEKVAERAARTSAQFKGKKLSAQQIEKQRISKQGYTHSKETRDKISVSHTGMKCSDEARKNMSIAHVGKLLTKQTKDKLSENNKFRKMISKFFGITYHATTKDLIALGKQLQLAGVI